MWWRKKEPKASRELPPIVERSLLWVSHLLQAWAVNLQRRAGQLSQRQLKGMLVVFSGLFLGASSVVIWNSVAAKNKGSFSVTPIKAIPLAPRKKPIPVLSEEEYRRIQRVKIYLDSLAGTEYGKRLRDSLLQARPHLVDTLIYLEQLYHEQNKK